MSPAKPPASSGEVLTPDAVALSAAVKQTLTPAFLRQVLGSSLVAYRARVLTIEVVVLCLLEMLLRGVPSIGVLVRRLRLGTLTSVAALQVTRQAFHQRLAALPHTVFLRLLQHVVAALRPDVVARADRAQLAPFATALVALDDTTLDALARKSDAFPHVATGTFAGLAGRLGCAVDLVTGLFRAVAYDTDAGSNERHRLLPLVATLPAGALVVFDRGYFAFDLFDALGARFVYFVTRMKDRVETRVIHTLVDSPLYRDQLVWLGGPGSTEAMTWPVRLLEVRVADGWWSYVTNVWDPQLLAADRVLRIYEARWTIERAFFAIKRALGLHSLYPCHPNGVLIQVWCTLILYQLLQVLRGAVARACRWDADDVSWPMLLQAVAMYGEQARPVPLHAWLVTHAGDLALRVRAPAQRRHWQPSAALRADLRTPSAPIPVAAIVPQRPRRRPPRFQRRPSQRVVASFSLDDALN